MMAKIFGANWKTTFTAIGTALSAGLTFLSGLSYDQGPISMIVPIKYKGKITLLAGTATLILWVWNGIQQKSKDVTGGTVQQTQSGGVADAGTQTLVDETIKASIKSGDDTVTPEQKAAVQGT